ncbi:hypothetical protein C8R46DRAFT_1024396 [Mycena filopes]|nr:hypothetical protein C8R46DRAFT_1024396 [Mycena filopes]
MSMWPTRSRECILPQVKIRYMNEEQRTVHIWNSLPVDRNRNTQPSSFRLLASFFVDNSPGREARQIRTHTLYRWLDLMTDAVNVDPIRFAADPGNDNSKSFRLVEVPDPRTHGLPSQQQFNLLPQMRATAGQSDQYVQEGHYIIVKVRRRGPEERLDAHGFDTNLPLIDQRNISRSGTNSAIKRIDSTRHATRYRDLRCRVSGSAVPKGSRGWDFTGLEVAHVFPLKAHSQVRAFQFDTAFKYESHKVTLYKPLDIPEKPPLRRIDISENTILLRADLHAQFDAYQFGFESSYNPQTKQWSRQSLRVFERDGAASIPRERIQTGTLFPPHADSLEGPDVHPLFTTHHLMTGLLWHVAGSGLRNMEEALIPVEFDDWLTGHAE